MSTVVGLALLLLAGSAAAHESAVGSTLEPFALDDQHGRTHRVDESVQLLLYSHDMSGGDLLKQALENVPEGYLDKRRALYVADISAMPRLVARFFAIPRLRKRAYPMLLDRDGAATAQLPGADGKATLIFLEHLRVTRLVFATTAEGVRNALGLPPPDEAEPEAAGDP
jgi:hypothetical protein